MIKHAVFLCVALTALAACTAKTSAADSDKPMVASVKVAHTLDLAPEPAPQQQSTTALDNACPAKEKVRALSPDCDPLRERCYEATDCLDATDPRAQEALKFLPAGEVTRGRLVEEGRHLETVLITPPGETSNFSNLCTGVLLSPKVVITAEHCFEHRVTVPGAAVTFGGSYSTGGFRTLVDKVQLASSGQTGSDMQLLLLKDPAPQSIRPVSVARPADVAAALHWSTVAQQTDINAALGGHVVGFGRTETNQIGVKMETNVGVVTRACDAETTTSSGEKLKDETLYGCRPKFELVAGAVRPRPGIYSDTCGGDSGGPLFVTRAEKAGQTTYFQSIATEYYLAAITKKGVSTAYIPAGKWPMCGNGGIYTLISGDNLKWVEMAMASWGERLAKRQ